MTEQVYSARFEDESFTMHEPAKKLMADADAHTRLGQYGDALNCLFMALKYDKKNAAVLINIGIIYELVNEFANSHHYYDMAKAAAPDHPLVRRFYAMHLLMSGDLANGWEESFWRSKAVKPKTLYHLIDAPSWTGEDLAGKHIAVWTEQGVGDEILTLTMMKDLYKRKPEAVSLVVSENMLKVFRDTFPNAMMYTRQELEKGEKFPLFPDYQASFSELGKQLRPTFSSFPNDAAYLSVNRKLSRELRTEYRNTTGAKPLVGISWASPSSAYPELKGTKLMAWKNILLQDQYQFVSLQYDRDSAEIAEVEKAYGISIIEEGGFDPKKDLKTFLAQVNAMDLIISVSNSTVHFAGALGKPVWNITPEKLKLWYWFQQRNDSPWYPTMKLFRNSITTDAVFGAGKYLRQVGAYHTFPEPE